MLTSPIIEKIQSDEVLKRCQRGEESTLDLKGVRERIVNISAAPQLVKDGDVVGADICARWLIGESQLPSIPGLTDSQKHN